MTLRPYKAMFHSTPTSDIEGREQVLVMTESTAPLAGGTIKIMARTGDHAPVQYSTCLTGAPKDWRFSDNLLGDPLFTEGLHNTIREALSQFTDIRDIPLRQVQNEIDLDHHGSNDIFSLVVKKVREY